MERPYWGPMYVNRECEKPGTSFAVHARDVHEQAEYSDDPFMEELKSLDLFASMRAAPLDPTGLLLLLRVTLCGWIAGSTPCWVEATIRSVIICVKCACQV